LSLCGVTSPLGVRIDLKLANLTICDTSSSSFSSVILGVPGMFDVIGAIFMFLVAIAFGLVAIAWAAAYVVMGARRRGSATRAEARDVRLTP
jgi:hypothetical protein